MTQKIIQVEGLGKKYRVGRLQSQARYTSLRDVMAKSAKSLQQYVMKPSTILANPASQEEDFWALKDVSFDVKQGDRVGIVGRNGAGKSTLLKILSRITEPTQGRISLQGRVASLLEVGTGFHPELTGRENIFLNGAILGMSRLEIRRKFDEIVAFAEVDKFLDVPVKRYSSGMYVRLAFAVAAHLEPEILIVDEVLAVGDAQFQNKCLGKMQDVAHSGRTVLFVSHNMAAIRQLCNTAVVLDHGRLSFMGNADTGIAYYLKNSQSHQAFTGKRSLYGLELQEVSLLESGSQLATLGPVFNQSYRLQLRFLAQESITQAAVVVRLFDAVGTLVSSICTPEEGINPFTLSGAIEVCFDLPKLQLMPGPYRLSVFVYRANDPGVYLEAEDALAFELYPAIVRDGMWAYRPDHGVVRIANGGLVRAISPECSEPKTSAPPVSDTNQMLKMAH